MSKTKGKPISKFRTKATNAYELLKEVRALILEEPKRYNQATILDHEMTAKSGQYIALFYGRPLAEYAPDCGTIGCRAGWITELTAPNPRHINDEVNYARKQLGITERQADNLFNGDAAGKTYGEWGTPEYARKGARGITVFMAHHKAQLLAKRVTPRA